MGPVRSASTVAKAMRHRSTTRIFGDSGIHARGQLQVRGKERCCSSKSSRSRKAAPPSKPEISQRQMMDANHGSITGSSSSITGSSSRTPTTRSNDDSNCKCFELQFSLHPNRVVVGYGYGLIDLPGSLSDRLEIRVEKGPHRRYKYPLHDISGNLWTLPKAPALSPETYASVKTQSRHSLACCSGFGKPASLNPACLSYTLLLDFL